MLNVLHGGGLIFDERRRMPNAKLIRYWISQPVPQGRTSSAPRGNSMFTPADASTGECNTAMSRVLLARGTRSGSPRLRVRSAGADAALPKPTTRAPAGHRPLHRIAHRPGPRLPGLLRRRARRVDRDRAAPHRLVQGAHRRRQGGLGASRAQLETTLTEAGATKTFRDVLLDDYLQRRARARRRLGPASRASRCSRSGPATSCRDTLGVEAHARPGAGRVLGHRLLARQPAAEPWSDQRLSPFFGIGVGKFKNIPNTSLVGATPTNAKLANATRRRCATT